MSIIRPTWQDDDGTGLTGQAIGNEELQEILDVVESSSIPNSQTSSNTGTQNDFSLNDRYTYLRATGDAPVFTGFDVGGGSPTDGDRLIVRNSGSGVVRFLHENGGSAPTRRLSLPATTGGHVMGARGVAEFVYDGVGVRWFLARSEPGAGINIPHGDVTFSACGSMTWTVGAGDLKRYTIYQEGRTVFFEFAVEDTTVGGTPSTLLTITLPFSFNALSNVTAFRTPAFVVDNGTAEVGFARVNPGVNLSFERGSLGNWSASTNDTDVHFIGQIMVD